MSELVSISKCTLNRSYGATTSATASFTVKVPFTDCPNNYPHPIYACQKAIGGTTEGIPVFGESVDAYTPLFCIDTNTSVDVKNSGSDYFLINVDCNYVQAAKLECNYLITMRSSMQSENTVFDIFGQKLTVSYIYPDNIMPTYQTQSVQVLRPTVELVATGISQTNNPTAVAAGWIGYLNNDVFNEWFAPHTLLCTGCNYEVHDLTSTPPHYKFQFTFSTSASETGWYPLMWFVDGQTGECPSDASISNGIATAYVYRGMNYNDTFPFNGKEKFIYTGNS